ncbi:MAG: hypothetical protein L0207_05255 [Chlamydiae bacterium]|nr:hypothetical protein [Chlamydiota bacterium]
MRPKNSKKRNIPISKVDSYREKKKKAFGKLKGTIHFKGDIVKPTDELWNVKF